MNRHPKYKSRLERERRSRVTKQQRHERALIDRWATKVTRRQMKAPDDAEILDLSEEQMY